jgi:hypothetical protein
MRNSLVSILCFLSICCTAIADGKPRAELITDRSAASEACGPTAIRWGFMCPIAAKFNDHVYALNFTRPPDVAWNTPTPNEAPIALWSRANDGKWSSVLLDSPKRTYQTPTLLISPDGRANVFTVHPFDSTIQWFRADDATNTKFTRREIPIGWGSYVSGAIDSKGRAALVYWGHGPDYPTATLGCTLLDTTTGKSRNLVVDSPGAPYCYNQVYFDRTGIHILGAKSEVTDFLVAGSKNHYTQLNYYHCANPDAAEPTWQRAVVVKNDRARFQPRGNLVDPSGRVHLLYQSVLDDGHGKETGGLKMIYTVSRDPSSATEAPTFVEHELETPGDARLFLTSDGTVHIAGHATSTTFQHARVLDAVAGKFSKWETISTGVTFSRIYPIDPRSSSTPTSKLEMVLMGAVGFPEENSIFYFTADAGSAEPPPARSQESK